MGDFLNKTGLTKVKSIIYSLLATKLNANLKGVANGVAELDANGKVPSAQLPSYVDDVVEYLGAENFPTTGEIDKIYLDTTTDLTYRWSGSRYVQVSQSLALGETSATAYRGDRGKAAYDHALANGTEYSTTGLYKFKTNAEGHVIYASAVTKSDITDLGIPGQNTTYSFTNSSPTLAWNTKSTVGTVGGVPLTVTMPANPNTWRGIQNNLTSTSTTDSLSAYQGKLLNDKITTGKDYGVYSSGTTEERIKAMLDLCYEDIDNGQAIVVEAFFTSLGTVTGTCSRRSDIMQFNLSVGINADVYYGWYAASTNYAIYSLSSKFTLTNGVVSTQTTVLSGGTVGSTIPSINVQYARFGSLVHLSYLFWGGAIAGANSNQLILSLPLSASQKTPRYYGHIGYSNTGISDMYTIIAAQNNTAAAQLLFAYKNTSGREAAVTGAQMSGKTVQGDIWYFTE